MALNPFKCNCLTPLHFKGLNGTRDARFQPVRDVANRHQSTSFGSELQDRQTQLTDPSHGQRRHKRSPWTAKPQIP